MKRLLTFSTLLRLIAAGLLFWALDRHQIGYFTVLRWCVCAVAVFVAYLAYLQGAVAWVWIAGLIAVLFNPLLIVRLSRQTWMPIDAATGIVLLISIWFVQEKRRPRERLGTEPI